MKKQLLKKGALGSLVFFVCAFVQVWPQQQDVPEPVFMNFSIQPLYVPIYHGRDPFRLINHTSRSPQVSITELDYHGVILLSGKPVVLFTWRGNSTILYTLKSKRLYSWEKEVDGVVGEITDREVILTQGDQKIVYSRK